MTGCRVVCWRCDGRGLSDQSVKASLRRYERIDAMLAAPGGGRISDAASAIIRGRRKKGVGWASAHQRTPVQPMPSYRRNRVEGGSYFFTVNLRDRHTDLLVAEIDALRGAVRAAQARHPFHIDAWVVLPDHTHCLRTLPPGDSDFPVRWQTIKAMFSRSVPPAADRRASLVRKREAGVWQRRYWEHTIRDDQDYAAHMDYIHFNPVRHGLAAHPADWPFSSFSRCVTLGIYPADWTSEGPGLVDTGER